LGFGKIKINLRIHAALLLVHKNDFSINGLNETFLYFENNKFRA